MAPRAPRTSFNSSRLIRLLAEQTTPDDTEAKQSLAERLGGWLGWADAISLSSVLNGHPAKPSTAPSGMPSSASAAGQELARVRAELAQAITTDELIMAGQPAAEASTDGAGLVDFSPYRRCYVGHQRAMEAGIRPLRATVRAALGSVSPALGRLAALDAVMDEALGARERHSLSTVPTLLERCFDGWRKAHLPMPAETGLPGRDPRVSPAGGWLAMYCKDMQGVLLAELEIRLQPVEGLMDALDQEITRQQ